MREAQEIFFDEKNWKPALNRSKQLVINTLLGIAVLYDSEDHGLSTHSRADLRPTAYRMDTFQRLIEQNLWGLELPLIVRGREISLNTLSGTPKGCYEGPIPGNRQLALQSPVFRGLDVRLAQLGLSPRRYRGRADGVFGNASATAIRIYQNNHRLPVTGIADVALIADLVKGF